MWSQANSKLSRPDPVDLIQRAVGRGQLNERICLTSLTRAPAYQNPIAPATAFSYSTVMASLADELARLRRNPKGIRFADLERGILRAGFTLDRSRGSHRSTFGGAGC